MNLLHEKINQYNVVLASKSPRRCELLSHIIKDFKIISADINEEFSPLLKINDIAKHIAEKKANFYADQVKVNDIYITADTIVILNNEILGKPKDEKDAFNMLKSLSGNSHLVHTGVSIIFNKKIYSFYDETKVTFYSLSNREIKDYINRCQPFDKAGSYGIQDWIGFVGIKKMEGDFFNVMGLPLHKLYRKLNSLLG
jgi:septum formation protein